MFRGQEGDKLLPPTARWEMVSEQTVAVLANNIDFPLLDMNTHRHYRLLFEITNAHAAAVFIGLYFNADHVHANYRHASMWAGGIVPAAMTNNQPRVALLGIGDPGSMVIDIVQYYGGRVGYTGYGFRDIGVNFQVRFYSGYWLTIPANVTQITLRCLDLANALQAGIAVGSRARLFRYYG